MSPEREQFGTCYRGEDTYAVERKARQPRSERTQLCQSLRGGPNQVEHAHMGNAGTFWTNNGVVSSRGPDPASNRASSVSVS